MRIKSSAIFPAPASHKLLLSLKILNVALFTNILVLCNDVASNPGPIDVTQSDLSSLEGSFSSPAEYSPSTTGTLFLSETDESDYSILISDSVKMVYVAARLFAEEINTE